MKITNWLVVLITAGVLAFATGCSKNDKATDRNKLGVEVEMPSLLEACQEVTKPEIQASLNQAALGLRYGQYERSLTELDKLAAAPELNDQQKKIAKKVSDQVKQLAAKVPTK